MQMQLTETSSSGRVFALASSAGSTLKVPGPMLWLPKFKEQRNDLHDPPPHTHIHVVESLGRPRHTAHSVCPTCTKEKTTFLRNSPELRWPIIFFNLLNLATRRVLIICFLTHGTLAFSSSTIGLSLRGDFRPRRPVSDSSTH